MLKPNTGGIKDAIRLIPIKSCDKLIMLFIASTITGKKATNMKNSATKAMIFAGFPMPFFILSPLKVRGERRWQTLWSKTMLGLEDAQHC